MIHLSLTPLLDIENGRTKVRSDIWCADCGSKFANDLDYCQFCHATDEAAKSRSIVSRIKSKFGFELSTELIVLSLEQPDHLFSESEIDSLLNLETMVPLETSDVPNWDIMFFNSKRLKKPTR